MVVSEEQERRLNTEGLRDIQTTHLLLYDDGELTPVVVKAGGWQRAGDGVAQSVTKLDHMENVERKKTTHRCDACGQVLWTQHALRGYVAIRWGISWVALATGQQGTNRRAQERVARSTVELEAGDYMTV